MSNQLRPPIYLLKEGSDSSQGKPQIIHNIRACLSIVDILKSTLGPKGMDKLIHQGREVTITNDGATVLKKLSIVHPAAEILVDISNSQDYEVGDGTTTVCLLTGELLNEARRFIEDDMHSRVIIKGYRRACKLALDQIKANKVKIDNREMLLNCASTSLNSKLVSGNKDFFSNMLVDAIENIEGFAQGTISVRQVSGGSITESCLVNGVAFKKCFSQAGFEQQPKNFNKPTILCLNVELELKAEKDNAEVRISDPSKQQSIVDAEWKIIQEKLDNIANLGCNIVLSKLPIGDLATQYFADRGMFCAGRVKEEDLKRLATASKAVIQTTCNGLTKEILGTCDKFEEKQIGSERWNFFHQPVNKTSTIILRGGSEQYTAEAERSLNDAIQIIKRVSKTKEIVAGGGAIELQVSKQIKEQSRSIEGKEQLVVLAFAKALETIPKTLAENAGLDSIEILNKLRKLHNENESNKNQGVDVEGTVADNQVAKVWEPAMSKLSSIASATEGATLILSIDQTIKAPKPDQDVKMKKARGGRRM